MKRKSNDPTMRWPGCLLWVFCAPAAIAVSVAHDCREEKKRVDRKWRKYHIGYWW